MKIVETDGKLIIEIDLAGPTRPTSSGKNLLVASTGGNMNMYTQTAGQIKIGLNVYKPVV